MVIHDRRKHDASHDRCNGGIASVTHQASLMQFLNCEHDVRKTLFDWFDNVIDDNFFGWGCAPNPAGRAYQYGYLVGLSTFLIKYHEVLHNFVHYFYNNPPPLPQFMDPPVKFPTPT